MKTFLLSSIKFHMLAKDPSNDYVNGKRIIPQNVQESFKKQIMQSTIIRDLEYVCQVLNIFYGTKYT